MNTLKRIAISLIVLTLPIHSLGMVSLTDNQMSKSFAKGVSYEFVNTPTNAEVGLVYLERALNEIGFPSLFGNYILVFDGISYASDVEPLSFSEDGQTAIIRLPNHIKSIYVQPSENSWLKDVGNIQIVDFRCSGCIITITPH